MMQTCSLAALLVSAAAVFATPGLAQAVSPGGLAVVNANGSLGANYNVVRVNHVSQGVYRVRFNQPTGNCAVTATVGGSTKTAVPGYIVVRRDQDIVGVHTFAAATLVPADFKFNLNLTCPPA
jgi:hypothetical protein